MFQKNDGLKSSDDQRYSLNNCVTNLCLFISNLTCLDSIFSHTENYGAAAFHLYIFFQKQVWMLKTFRSQFLRVVPCWYLEGRWYMATCTDQKHGYDYVKTKNCVGNVAAQNIERKCETTLSVICMSEPSMCSNIKTYNTFETEWCNAWIFAAVCIIVANIFFSVHHECGNVFFGCFGEGEAVYVKK